MFIKAVEIVTKSIFPIFYKANLGSQTIIGVSGTGFFIDDNGLFVTANHVMKEVPENSSMLYCGNIPHNIIQPIRIQSVLADAERDIFVGKVENQYKLPKVNLSKEEAKIGQSLCLCGYPLAVLSLNVDGSINVSNVRKYWQPTFAIDYFQGLENGRKYIGFITQHTSLSGMSGGPVFGIDGTVYGIDVATFTRKIPNPSLPMLVSNGVVNGINYLEDIINKASMISNEPSNNQPTTSIPSN